MTKYTFHYDPKTEPLQPIIEEIKAGNLPFKVKCNDRGKALHVSQRLYKIFRWYKEQFKKQELAPPNFPELTVREDKRKKKFFVHIKDRPNLGTLITKEGDTVEIKSGKQNWNFEKKEEREIEA